MRHTIAFILAVLTCLAVRGQGNMEIQQKKRHYGAVNGGEWVIRPMYDSLVQADSVIVTGYRKGRIYYLNAAGETMYKGKVRRSERFIHGMGLVQDKDDRFVLLNREGNMLSQPSLLAERPKRFGKFAYLQHVYENENGSRTRNNCLYTSSGLQMDDIFSIETPGEFLVAADWVGSPKHTTESTLWDPNSGDKLEENISNISDRMGHLILRKTNGGSTLYEKATGKWLRGMGEIEVVDNTYFISKTGSQKSLYRWQNHQLLISANCARFEFKPDYIRAVLKEDTTAGLLVSLYDYAGAPLITDLLIQHRYEDGRFHLVHQGMEYIGKENGDALSERYKKISPVAVNGFRIVSTDSTYSYISDHNYRKMPVDFPILYKRREVVTSPAKGGLIRGLATALLLPVMVVPSMLMAIPTQGKSMDWLKDLAGVGTSNPSIRQDQYELIAPGPDQLFIEGYAIFCHHQPVAAGGPALVSSPDKLTFNYIDTTGASLNAMRYSDCLPFRSGKAWVQEGGYWKQINRKGKGVGADRFQSLAPQEDGFLFASNSYTVHRLIFFTHTYHEFVLYGPDNNRLHKGTFSSIERVGNVYYGVNDGRKVKLADVPVTKVE